MAKRLVFSRSGFLRESSMADLEYTLAYARASAIADRVVEDIAHVQEYRDNIQIKE